MTDTSIHPGEVVKEGLVFAAGWNTPGYLPDAEPEVFATYVEAIRYLANTVERFWDEDATSFSGAEADRRWLDVHAALHNVRAGGQTFAALGGGYVFWVQPQAVL